jgi:apolipoprotein N-acyltransferase
MKLRPALPPLSLRSDGLLWQSMVAVASALLLLLSFPPFDFHYLAWIALAPLLLVIAGGVTVRRAFWLGWMMGIEFTFFAENWIAHSMTYFGGMLAVVAYAVALLFAAALAIFPAIFAGVMARAVNVWGLRAMVAAPVVWAATEWIRPYVTGVTWNALGVSQYRSYSIARLAQYGGVYLLSAELLAGSALLAMLMKSRERGVIRAVAILAICAIVPLLALESQPRSPMDPRAPVTVVGVQPNLPPDKPTTETDLENNVKLTKEAIDRSPGKKTDIIIWAESPLTIFYDGDPAAREKLDALVSETGAHLIFNSVARDGERYFNSVQTISPQTGPQSHKRYDKMRLVPFGEYVPFNALLKYVVPRVISSDTGGFAAGSEAVVNVLKLSAEREILISKDEEGAAIERTTEFVRVGSFICYEAAYPDLVRRFVRNGATLLVNVSNDAWFGNTAGARQHLAHAAMRAIENDRQLIRVTNSGISALVTERGEVVDPLPMFAAGSRLWQAIPRREITFYARRGDWFGAGCAIATLLISGLILFVGHTRKPR